MHSWTLSSGGCLYKTWTRLDPSPFHHGRGKESWDPTPLWGTIDSKSREDRSFLEWCNHWQIAHYLIYNHHTRSYSQPYLNSMDHYIHKKDVKGGGGLRKTKRFQGERQDRWGRVVRGGYERLKSTIHMNETVKEWNFNYDLQFIYFAVVTQYSIWRATLVLELGTEVYHI